MFRSRTRRLFATTWIICLIIFTLSCCPGRLSFVVAIPGGCCSWPLIAVWIFFQAGYAWRDGIAHDSPNQTPDWWGMRGFLVMLVTAVLVVSRVPQRITIVVCSPSLQALVKDAPQGGFHGAEFPNPTGLAPIDRYAADPRGGVFFRTAFRSEGIGPDWMSYGFVYRPNGDGSPFGNARYRQRHLVGDWYSFAVSDDW